MRVEAIQKNGQSKVMTSLAMLVSWEIWKETTPYLSHACFKNQRESRLCEASLGQKPYVTV
jgi:hypothetical protein